MSIMDFWLQEKMPQCILYYFSNFQRYIVVSEPLDVLKNYMKIKIIKSLSDKV